MNYLIIVFSGLFMFIGIFYIIKRYGDINIPNILSFVIALVLLQLSIYPLDGFETTMLILDNEPSNNIILQFIMFVFIIVMFSFIAILYLIRKK